MREVDFDSLTAADLVDVEALKDAFMDYVKKEFHYSNFEAQMVATDLDDPYETEFLYMDYQGETTIDGIEYEIRACKTDFMLCGLYHLANAKPFEFYMLIDTSDMPDSTVGSYCRARKVFIL